MLETPSENPQTPEKNEGPHFLYHMVPEDMQGNTLHPLNTLKDVYPELYVEKVKKYKDREHIMQQFIPTLESAWNDVLHFSPVSPEDLKKALVEAGGEPREMKFYQVDPKLLDPKQTTIYIYSKEEALKSEDFIEYDPARLDEHSSLSQETKDYYKEVLQKGDKPLLFVGVPHILHKGSLDISDLPVITV